MIKPKTGETIALYLSQSDEATFREYSKRTGVDFNSIIQSSICDQIECHKDSSPFEALPELLNTKISQREITAEIHPLVFDLANRAAAALGVEAVRLVALAISQDALCLASDLEELDQHEADFGEIPATRMSDTVWRAKEAVNLKYLLSLKSPTLGHLQSDPWRIITFEGQINLVSS